MGKLDARNRTILMVEVHKTFQSCNVGIVIDAGAAMGDAARTRHAGGLDSNRRRAAEHQPARMDKVPVLQMAVDGLVLAHRRHDDAISKLAIANTQCREEKRGGRHWPFVGAFGYSAAAARGLSRASTTPSSSRMTSMTLATRASPSLPSSRNVVSGGRTSPTGSPWAAASAFDSHR